MRDWVMGLVNQSFIHNLPPLSLFFLPSFYLSFSVATSPSSLYPSFISFSSQLKVTLYPQVSLSLSSALSLLFPARSLDSAAVSLAPLRPIVEHINM